MKTSMIFGVNGQDGSYLAELLLSKNYYVIGVRRRASVEDNSNIEGILDNPNFSLQYGELTDYCSMSGLIDSNRPDEIYNLAAQSFVGASFDQPLYTWNTNAQGVVNILEIIRSLKSESYNPKLYQASTSEMFGHKYSVRLVDEGGGIGCVDPTFEKFQAENTEMDPQSPYGVAKLAAHRSIGLYRRAYGLFACSGILFNHEGPRRGKQFVTRKITDYIGKLKAWIDKESGLFDDGQTAFYKQDHDNNIYIQYTDIIGFPKLRLGNIDSYRDWGHSRDYVEAMWLMLQQDTPDDYVICTGETHTVREFLEEAFSHIGLDWKKYVRIDPGLFRPAEVDYLRGDCSKAKKILGWEPKTTFKDLVKEMVYNDIEKARQ